MSSEKGSKRINLVIWMGLILVLIVSLAGCEMPKTYTGTPVKVLVVDIITPTPTLVPTFTPTPVAQTDSCSQYVDENWCVEKSLGTCKWVPNIITAGGKCVSK